MNVNNTDIDTDKPLAGIVNTDLLRVTLAALIERALGLAQGIAGQIGTPSSALKDALKTSLKLALMHTRVDKQIREGEIHNMNIRLRDWVLSCVARRLYIRSQIGAQRISHWYKRRDVLAGNISPVPKDAPKLGFGLAVCRPFAKPFKRRIIKRRDWFTLKRQSVGFTAFQPLMPSIGVTIPRIKLPTISQPKQAEFHPDELTEEFVYEPVLVGEVECATTPSPLPLTPPKGGVHPNTELNNHALDPVLRHPKSTSSLSLMARDERQGENDERKEEGEPVSQDLKPP